MIITETFIIFCILQLPRKFGWCNLKSVRKRNKSIHIQRICLIPIKGIHTKRPFLCVQWHMRHNMNEPLLEKQFPFLGNLESHFIVAKKCSFSLFYIENWKLLVTFYIVQLLTPSLFSNSQIVSLFKEQIVWRRFHLLTVSRREGEFPFVVKNLVNALKT